jgi:pyruvate/2-oxoglutarate/acetoin dehydrogenase E1 component
LLLTSIRDNNPVLFLEHKLLYRTKGDVDDQAGAIPLGKAHVARQGKDLTILTYSHMVLKALEAANELEKEGINLEVIDLRTLKPLDMETILTSVRKTGRVLIIHEAPITGGFGGELAAMIASSDAFYLLDAPIERLAGRNVPIPYNRTLERASVPQVEDIINRARNLATEGR